jgi:gamma-glutamyltranspeptidase
MESTIVSWLVTEGHNGTTETPVVKDFDENDIASMPRPMGSGFFPVKTLKWIGAG